MLIEKLNVNQSSLNGEVLHLLKQHAHELFGENEHIRLEALRELIGEAIDDDKEHYQLMWKGKRESKRIANDLRTGKTITPNGGVGDWDKTQNVFIEGDNLTVLKVLHRAYAKQIKCIYIDPPYNTGKDFVYKDDYKMSVDEYNRDVGLVDEEGNVTTSNMKLNSKSNGRYHANWLSMMYPRLKIASELLHHDGLIFVSIDDNEVHNLRMLMNEIFGEENYKNSIAVRRGIKNVQMQFDTIDKLSVGHEYILCYSKSPIRLEKLMHHLNFQEDGKWDTFWRGTDRPTLRYELFDQSPSKGQWRWEPNRTKNAIENYKKYLEKFASEFTLDEYYNEHYFATNEELDFVRLNDENVIQYYVAPRSYKLMSDNWMDLSIRGNYTVFDTEKSIEVIQRIIKWILPKNDLNECGYILDFFAGSGTTAHAVMQLNAEDGGNRPYICVQLDEKPVSKSAAAQVGYTSIAEITKERIKNASDEIHSQNEKEKLETLDLGCRFYKVTDAIRIDEQLTQSTTLQIETDDFLMHEALRPGWKLETLLWEIALSEGYPLDSIMTKDMNFVKNTVYRLIHVNPNIGKPTLMICLDDVIHLETFTAWCASDEKDIIVCRDTALSDDASKLTLTDRRYVRVI